MRRGLKKRKKRPRKENFRRSSASRTSLSKFLRVSLYALLVRLALVNHLYYLLCFMKCFLFHKKWLIILRETKTWKRNSIKMRPRPFIRNSLAIIPKLVTLMLKSMVLLPTLNNLHGSETRLLEKTSFTICLSNSRNMLIPFNIVNLSVIFACKRKVIKLLLETEVLHSLAVKRLDLVSLEPFTKTKKSI